VTSGTLTSSGGSRVNGTLTVGTGGGGTYATIQLSGGVTTTIQYDNGNSSFEFLTAAANGFYFDKAARFGNTVTSTNGFVSPSNTWATAWTAATNGLGVGSFISGVNSNGAAIWTIQNVSGTMTPVAHTP
jgi:hypothetical protein